MYPCTHITRDTCIPLNMQPCIPRVPAQPSLITSVVCIPMFSWKFLEKQQWKFSWRKFWRKVIYRESKFAENFIIMFRMDAIKYENLLSKISFLWEILKCLYFIVRALAFHKLLHIELVNTSYPFNNFGRWNMLLSASTNFTPAYFTSRVFFRLRTTFILIKSENVYFISDFNNIFVPICNFNYLSPVYTTLKFSLIGTARLKLVPEPNFISAQPTNTKPAHGWNWYGYTI